jgi:hypothetical protein
VFFSPLHSPSGSSFPSSGRTPSTTNSRYIRNMGPVRGEATSDVERGWSRQTVSKERREERGENAP